MGFVGQLYASAWFQIGGHLALQFYVCDECKEDHKHLNMEALPKSAPPNAKGAGVHCPSQPKRYISYTPVEDSTDQWTLNRSKLAEEELPDKHLREDKIGGLFPYDGYDSPKITKSNIMIAQFSWKGIGAMVYLYHSTHHGIYAYLYW